MIAIRLSYTTYQQQKGGVCLPFVVGTGVHNGLDLN